MLSRQSIGMRIWRLAVLAPLVALAGCGLADAPIINPGGPITLAERNLLFTAFAVMMIVAVPVYVITIFVLLRYRASRPTGVYAPRWTGSWQLEAAIWLIPAAIVVALGVLLWTSTQRLDPYKPIAGHGEAFEVHAIAQDWKWLFIYPELGVASVNELAFPADRPVHFKITSDTVMNSFFIPALAGQIYAMAGMTSQLHLIADEPGVFRGRNSLFSGDGYDDQRFLAHALSDQDFAVWSDKVKAAGTALDARTYVELVKPSANHPVTYYATYEPDLFDIVLSKYAPASERIETEAAAIICGRAA